MYRLISLVISAVLIFSIVGCVAPNISENNQQSPSNSTPSGNVQSPTNSQPASGDHIHQYVDWTVITELSCETDGVKTSTCTTCGETTVETTKATGHSFENDVCVYCKWVKPVPSEGLTFELNEYKTGYLVTDIGSFTGENLVIPDTYEGLPVVEIDPQAFRDAKFISAYIPDSVTIIRAAAFQNCKSLTSVTGMRNVVFIDSYAFTNCSALQDFHFPNNMVQLGDQLFNGCTSLTSLHIPASITKLDGRFSSSFYQPVNMLGAPNLTSLTVDPNNPVLYSSGNCLIHREKKKLLAGCANSVIPNDGSVTSIADHAFARTQLEQITLPDGIEYIGSHIFDETPFYDDSNNWKEYENGKALYINNYLIEADIYYGTFVIEEGTILVAKDVLDGSLLSKVQFPSSMRYLGNSLFSGCEYLKEIIFLHGLEELSSNMMLGVANVESITLPSSITCIYGGALSGQLQSIYYDGTIAQWEAIEKYSGWKNGVYFFDPLTIYCTDGEIVITE